jgi:hypothetical protein
MANCECHNQRVKTVFNEHPPGPAGELAQMAKSKAAKLEWLLLQRLAPEALRLGEEWQCLKDRKCIGHT